MDDILFEVNCYYFNKKIRTTGDYWRKIVDNKHPSIKGNEEKVVSTLQNPDEIRQSKRFNDVSLYYKQFVEGYVCVVVKLLNDEGFIVTAYHTTKIKEGGLVWKK